METPEPKVVLGMILSEGCKRVTGFTPSKEVCDKFADRVLEEARDSGHEIQFQSVSIK